MAAAAPVPVVGIPVTGIPPVSAPHPDAIDDTGGVAALNITSVYAQAAEKHQAFVAQQVKAPKTTKKKTEKAKVEKDPTRSQRTQASHVIHTKIPPARGLFFLHEGLKTPDSEKHTQLTGAIRKLRQALSNKYTPEEVATGKAPTGAQRAQMEQHIATYLQAIKDQNLSDASVRVANDTGPALVAALDWIALAMIDLVASNTLSADKKIAKLRFTLARESTPKAEAGGVRIEESSVGPFLAPLPTIVNYNQAIEDEYERVEAEKKKNERLEKKEKQRLAADAETAQQLVANQMLTQLAKQAPEGSTPEEAMAYAQQQYAVQRQAQANGAKAEEKNATKRRTPGDRAFLTYIEQLCKAAQQLHPGFEGLRVSGRFKMHLDLLLREFIHFFAATVRSSITTHTLSAINVMNMLEARQRFCGRPQFEIDQLKTAMQTAVRYWNDHGSKKKDEKELIAAAKLSSMSAPERAEFEKKRLEADAQRLRTSLAAQERKFEKARAEAAVKAAEIQQVEANLGAVASVLAQAPVAGSTAPGFVTGIAPVAPAGMAWLPPQ
jgi:hypothetical protein